MTLEEKFQLLLDIAQKAAKTFDELEAVFKIKNKSVLQAVCHIASQATKAVITEVTKGSDEDKQEADL